MGDERVVAMLFGKYDRSGGWCSGTLITDRIALTAAHCLGKSGVPGEVTFNHWEYWISQPGVDITSDDVDTRVQSAYVAIVKDYTNIYNPEGGDTRG